jgi:tetratricopeptide (TPR) repeat protein
MKKFPILILAFITVALLALPSLALSPNRIGESNFERGWRRLMHDNREEAVEAFAVGAQAYSEALAEQPRARYTNFLSNLAKAGMSFYYAGRFEEAADVLAEVYEPNSKLWESAIYSAMSYAYLGDKAKTIEWLERFHAMYSDAQILSNVAHRQLVGLVSGDVSTDAAADALDKAVFRQSRYNVSNMGQAQAFGSDSCSGAYWWRYAYRPCKNNLRYRN